jgi:hypothetical protein
MHLQLLPISLVWRLWRFNLDHRADERLIVALAAFALLPDIVTGRNKLRLLVVIAALHKEVVADDTETPEHVRGVLAVFSQTVAQRFVKTASCRHGDS